MTGVLVEIKNVRQEPGVGRRRWFECHGYELVVWYRTGGEVQGFQVMYQREGRDYALTWREGEGFKHDWIDGGNDSPLKNLTPVLTPAGPIPWSLVGREFAAQGQSLEEELRRFVQQRLEARA